MAVGDIKIFTIEEDGVTFEVTAIDLGDDKTSISIKCIDGQGDVNAFFYHDGDDVGGDLAFSGKQNSLNMNGTGEEWDAYHAVSDTGLKKEGTDKHSYLIADSDQDTLGTFTIEWNFDDLDTIGIRATSVGEDLSGSIKGVASDPEPIDFPTITVSNATVTEGDDEFAVVTIELDGEYPYPIEVEYTTKDGTAKDGSDYNEPVTTTVTFLPGDTVKTIEIEIIDDDVVEEDETFTVELLSATPDIPGDPDPVIDLEGLATSSATVTIIDDDELEISIVQSQEQADDGVTESEAASFTINLSHELGDGVTASVDIAIDLPGGLSGADEDDFTQTFLDAVGASLPPGVTLSGNTLTFDSTFDHDVGFTFTLATEDDDLVEGDESFTVTLSSPSSNASVDPVLGTASQTTFIVDDDELEISIVQSQEQADDGVTEGDAACYTVNLSHELGEGVTASVTIGISLVGGAGFAEADDFPNSFGFDVKAAADNTLGVAAVDNLDGTVTLTFDDEFDYEEGFKFSLLTVADDGFEGDESYEVSLVASSIDSNASLTPVLGNATVETTIIDGDQEEPANQAPTDLHFVMTAQSGNSLNLGYFQAFDPDVGDTLTYSSEYSASDGEASVSVNSSTGELSFSGDGSNTQEGTLTVTATDEAGDSVSKQFHIWIGDSGPDERSFAVLSNDVIAAGRGAADTITGSDGVDFLFGGGGGDTLIGGGGGDWLSGGNGSDIFKYLAVTDSTPDDFDKIVDWGSGNNTIDLGDIDADTGDGGNQPFTFEGEDNNVIANSITWHQTVLDLGAGNQDVTVIQGDVNGNTDADLYIVLLGHHTLSASDFSGVI